MRTDFETKFKKALEFLRNFDISSPHKPVIPHDIRVGQYLYEKGFSDEVVNAGILHDMIEWSSVSEEEIKDQFGDRVLQLIKVNSKDRSITDSYKRKVDMMERCKKVGDDAFALKIVDIVDSFNYYSPLQDERGLEHCRSHARLLLENLPDNLKIIFKEDLDNF